MYVLLCVYLNRQNTAAVLYEGVRPEGDRFEDEPSLSYTYVSLYVCLPACLPVLLPSCLPVYLHVCPFL